MPKLISLLGCFDSLRADVLFGWHQVVKSQVTTAAMLSLALAGACVSTFQEHDTLSHPMFRRVRDALTAQTEVIVMSYVDGTGIKMERAHCQYISGWMFSSFGINVVIGRLFTEEHDLEPGVHSEAVLFIDY